MANEYEEQRRRKAAALREKGLDPFGHRYPDVIGAAEARRRFDAAGEGAPARCAGRLTAMREFGKLIFGDLSDWTGRIQIAFSKKTLPPEDWERVKLLDLGDWVGVDGRLVKTRTGEITVEIAKFEILSKSLLPPPEKWHGLQDVEARYRQRYVDLFANPEVRDVFLKRSLILDEMRRFLRERGFVEVETPVLSRCTAGRPPGRSSRITTRWTWTCTCASRPNCT